jgi:hypothetical protein
VDEEKKFEESWEEAERLGPYQIHEQVPRARHSRGELYRAVHETSGATALVFKPVAEKDAVPLKDWRVRVISSASHGYIALEVEESPWSLSLSRYSVEALVFTFEALRDGVRRMVHLLPAFDEPHSRWGLGLRLAGAAAVCALLFALVRLVSVLQPSSDPEPLASTASAPTSYCVPMAAEKPDPFFTSDWLVDTMPQGEPVFARPIPREPVKGQKRPPCNRHIEVEVMGACWMPHELKAPCPNELYEHQGKCYAPVGNPKPPPQSLGQ